MMPPCAATFSMAKPMRPKSSRLPDRLGCGGRILVVKTLKDGCPCWIAAGLIVAPGGVEPHTHLAHAIMSHPESPSITLGPEEDTRGMACGGTTTRDAT